MWKLWLICVEIKLTTEESQMTKKDFYVFFKKRTVGIISISLSSFHPPVKPASVDIAVFDDSIEQGNSLIYMVPHL